jgi:hypothetical protein
MLYRSPNIKRNPFFIFQIFYIISWPKTMHRNSRSLRTINKFIEVRHIFCLNRNKLDLIMILNLIYTYSPNIKEVCIIYVKNFNCILPVYLEEQKVSRVNFKEKSVEGIISILKTLFYVFYMKIMSVFFLINTLFF